MKKILFLVMGVVFLAGCVSAKFSQYISDKNPYKKEFFVPFDQALGATKSALADLGWEVSDEGSPAVYEQAAGYRAQELILFTNIRQTPLFLGSRFAKLNAILRSNDTVTEIEIRYLTITSLPFRNIESYRNDKAVERVFERIAEELKK